MTSYQARLTEIRELQNEIDILTGDDFLKAEELKAIYRMRREQQRAIDFGCRKPEEEPKARGILLMITESAKRRMHKRIHTQSTL